MRHVSSARSPSTTSQAHRPQGLLRNSKNDAATRWLTSGVMGSIEIMKTSLMQTKWFTDKPCGFHLHLVDFDGIQGFNGGIGRDNTFPNPGMLFWQKNLGLKSRTLTWRRAKRNAKRVAETGNALTWRVAWIEGEASNGCLLNRSHRLADLLAYLLHGCVGVTPFSCETSEASNGCLIQGAKRRPWIVMPKVGIPCERVFSHSSQPLGISQYPKSGSDHIRTAYSSKLWILSRTTFPTEAAEVQQRFSSAPQISSCSATLSLQEGCVLGWAEKLGHELHHPLHISAASPATKQRSLHVQNGNAPNFKSSWLSTVHFCRCHHETKVCKIQISTEHVQNFCPEALLPPHNHLRKKS